MKLKHTLQRRRQTGAATLVIVLMLFFVLALVAAYTNRNLVFEQRTSVNQYRSTMVFEAADAGIEWAVGLLNGGRIGADCREASALPDSTSFRQRYLSINPNSGLVTAKNNPATATALQVTCVWTGTAWDCHCPTEADPPGPPPLVPPTGAGLHPAFRLEFFPAPARPGVIRLKVNACMSLDETCLSEFGNTPIASEGRAQHSTLLVLKPAASTPPVAALTVIGDVSGAGAAVLENSALDANNLGRSLATLRSAGVNSAPSLTLKGPAGSVGSDTEFINDTALLPDGLTLADLRSTPIDPLKWERVFAWTHGLLPGSYQNQPGAIPLTCSPAGCRAALTDLVLKNPDRVIWVTGDLVLESAGDIGSAPNPSNPAVASPAYIVVNGNVRFLSAGVRIFGVVYSRSGVWDGPGLINGAALVEGDLTVNGALEVVYDKAIVGHTQYNSGSFVMLNGEWKDFVR